MVNEIRFDRLGQIADHLEEGKLAHERFDFMSYNENESGYHKPIGNECGTMGCAVGEFPAIWPERFEWRGNAIIDIQTKKRDSLATIGWVGIDENIYYHLFVPNSQIPQQFGGKQLDRFATKDQLAANIRAFIAKMSAHD